MIDLCIRGRLLPIHPLPEWWGLDVKLSRLARTGAVFLIVWTLIGCAALFVQAVDDLRFERLEFVEHKALDLHDSETWRQRASADYSIGKIVVSTHANIHDIAVASGLNTWRDLKTCDNNALVVGIGAWGIYYKGVDVNPNSMSEPHKALYRERITAHRAGSRFEYEIYFASRSALDKDKGLGQPENWKPYDLVGMPRDLCLRIGGGNMVGGHFISNLVVISADALKRAAASLTEQSGGAGRT